MWVYLNQIQAKLLDGIFEALWRINQLSKAPKEWVTKSQKRPILDNACDRFTLDQEVG